jgi:hypothetical protein
VRRLCFFVLLLVTLAPREVRAQAETLIEQGVRLREAGRDEDAVSAFRRARAVEDSPQVQTQLGLALLATGEFVESYELLSAALLSHDPWVESRRAAIEGSFDSASAHVGLVEVTGGEPGANVIVNGQVVGAMPLTRPVHALAGRAIVEVSLAGYHRTINEVAVEPGQTARLRVALIRRVEEAPPSGSSDDWVLPVAIGGGVLLLGGIIAAVVVASLPGEPPLPEVLGTATTLQARF